MTDADLKDLYERQSRVMTRHPGYAAASGRARVRLLDGLRCEVTHDDRTAVVDLPPSEGGTGSAPHPGQLMRASLGACLTMGYRLWAARLDVPIEKVEVDVVCHYDPRGQLGISEDVPVGWRRIHVDVTITSPAPPDRVRALVEHANRLSPMLANLSPAIHQVHALIVIPSATASRT